MIKRPASLSIFSTLLALCVSTAFASETYFVAKSGADTNSGTKSAPFLTINEAAQRAQPGDTVLVSAGIYREWVDPPRGGTSESNRIVYEAVEGDIVVISGSVPAKSWTKQGDRWQLDVPVKSFGAFNPFAEGIRHPSYVEEDEAGDGWGWLKYGRWAHRGDVFVDGKGLTEKETADELTTPFTWTTTTDQSRTRITANFGDLNPNKARTEISRLPFGFFPSEPGLNYITVRGFVVENIATHWTPPTEFQPGAIGTNGGHSWIIENNAVLRSRGVAISIGVPSKEIKQDKIGHHIVRNNALLWNGQAGIAGQSWNHHSLISGNWIEDTNYRTEFGGWETAGIKIHNADGVRIEDNVILNVSSADLEIGAAHGVWVDYQNINSNVSRNTIIGAQGMAILTEANWDGPTRIDNNIAFGGGLGTFSSRGDHWLHNLFVDTKPTWVNQDWGNRVPVGNGQWLRNTLIGQGLQDFPTDAKNLIARNNVYGAGATPAPTEANSPVLPSLNASWRRADQCTVKIEIDTGTLATPFPQVPSISFDDLGVSLTQKGEVSDVRNVDFQGVARSGTTTSIGPFDRLPTGTTHEIEVRAPDSLAHALHYVVGNKTDACVQPTEHPDPQRP